MSELVGKEVTWHDSNYVIVEVSKKGALLKQLFSIGTTLNDYVKLEELIFKN